MSHHPILLSLTVFLLLSIALVFYFQGYHSTTVSPLRVSVAERTLESGETLKGFLLGQPTNKEVTIRLISRTTTNEVAVSTLLFTKQSTPFTLTIPPTTLSGSYTLRVTHQQQKVESLILITRPQPAAMQTIENKTPTPIKDENKTISIPAQRHDTLEQLPSTEENPRQTCSQLSSRLSYETCIAYNAHHIDDCAILTDRELKDQCIVRIILNTKQIELCEQITSTTLQQECKTIT